MFLLFRNLSIKRSLYLKSNFWMIVLFGAGKEVLILCVESDGKNSAQLRKVEL